MGKEDRREIGMIERYYIYTVAFCRESLIYALSWLLNQLNENDIGGIVVGWGNLKKGFCNKSKLYWDTPHFKKILPAICNKKQVKINGKTIKLIHSQYKYNQKLIYKEEIPRVKAIIVIHPLLGKEVLVDIEDVFYQIDHYNDYFNDEYLTQEMLVVPWSKFGTQQWVEDYNPQRIDIEYEGSYEYRDI